MTYHRFSIIQGRAVVDRRVSNAQLRTLCALGMYADEDGWCWPSQSTLGKDVGKSRQTVNGDIAALVELGYIELQHDQREDGGWTSNKYRLLFDTPPVESPKHPPSNLSDTNDPSNDPNNNTASEEKPSSLPDIPMSIENQIYLGRKEVVMPDEKDMAMKTAANTIAIGMGGMTDKAYLIAYAFMKKRDIIIPEGQCKGQRKPIRNMIQAGVTPKVVEEATEQLMSARDKNGKPFTIANLYQVESTAISLANPILDMDFSQPQESRFESMDDLGE